MFPRTSYTLTMDPAITALRQITLEADSPHDALGIFSTYCPALVGSVRTISAVYLTAADVFTPDEIDTMLDVVGSIAS